MNPLIIKEYFDKRVEKTNSNSTINKPGPTITISRAPGCLATELAFEIAKELNKRLKSEKWSVINKEILHNTAEQINVTSETIENTLNLEEKSFFDEIIFAFLSSDYQLEYKVRKTLIKVIRKFCVEGYRIIIGRGGNTISSDIENSFHIRLDAPFQERIKNIMKVKNLTELSATEYVKTTEKQRKKFNESIKGDKLLAEDYDLIINTSKFSNNEIITIVIKALELKNMIF